MRFTTWWAAALGFCVTFATGLALSLCLDGPHRRNASRVDTLTVWRPRLLREEEVEEARRGKVGAGGGGGAATNITEKHPPVRDGDAPLSEVLLDSDPLAGDSPRGSSSSSSTGGRRLEDLAGKQAWAGHG